MFLSLFHVMDFLKKWEPNSVDERNTAAPEQQQPSRGVEIFGLRNEFQQLEECLNLLAPLWLRHCPHALHFLTQSLPLLSNLECH